MRVKQWVDQMHREKEELIKEETNMCVRERGE